MGEVYRATDRDAGFQVALKFVLRDDERLSARLAQEARALVQLRHPAIVRYVSHGVTPTGVAYLAMEWLEGETLAQRLSRAALSVDDSLRLVEGLPTVSALRATSSSWEGVSGRRRSRDFGLARDAAESLTATGARLGTPRYLAPEQASGERSIGPAADVFSPPGIPRRAPP